MKLSYDQVLLVDAGGFFPESDGPEYQDVAGFLMDLGLWFFTAAVAFQFVTLPVEFDASKRALAQLTETGAVMPEEVAQAKQVLDAAALTYVAAAAMAALQLVRLVLIRNSRN